MERRKRSPEETLAILEDLQRRRKAEKEAAAKAAARPKVVVSEGRPVRDADVAVSPADPNAVNATGGVVSVRRRDFVTINMAAYEEQRALQDAQRQRDRQLDPYRLGLYGGADDE